ncbi:hypothetical protein V8G54_024756 [Vigna mungo]|uniref:PPM-type phosphatase domain-containing protein n=1 Tax=Vigna mungo TaxID=3915 RepID=A0AAQ3N6Z2_VIGMU
MTGKEILHKMKEKVLGPSDSDSGKGKSKMKKHITHGFHLVKGRSGHAMEDYVVAQFKQVDNNELGLFAIFDGHSGELGRGGSTAVTAILINCQKLVVANIGDSRAVLCQNGQAKQLSVDHEPSVESEDIKNRGGFVSNFPGTNHILKCCMVFYLHLHSVLHNIRGFSFTC